MNIRRGAKRQPAKIGFLKDFFGDYGGCFGIGRRLWGLFQDLVATMCGCFCRKVFGISLLPITTSL